MKLEQVLHKFQAEFLIAALRTGDASGDQASVQRAVQICNAYMKGMAVGLPFAEGEVKAWKLPFSESKQHAVLALGIAQMVEQMPAGPAPAVATLRHVFETALAAAPSARPHIKVDWSNAERPDPSETVSEAVSAAIASQDDCRLNAATVRQLRQVGRDVGVDDLDGILAAASSSSGSAGLAPPLRLVIEDTVRHASANHSEPVRKSIGSVMVTSFHVGRLLLPPPHSARALGDSDLGRLAMLTRNLEPAEVFDDSTIEPLYVEFLLRSIEGDYPLVDLAPDVRHSLITTAAWRGLLLAVAAYDITVTSADSSGGEYAPIDQSPTRPPDGPDGGDIAPKGLLTDCAACDRPVSRMATACPKCGHPVGLGATEE